MAAGVTQRGDLRLQHGSIPLAGAEPFVQVGAAADSLQREIERGKIIASHPTLTVVYPIGADNYLPGLDR